jgi:hypothetical protein
VLLHPFIPATSDAIRERLGLAPEGGFAPGALVPDWSEAGWGRLPDGLTVSVGPALFPRIED